MAAVGIGDFTNFTQNEGDSDLAFMLGGGYEIYNTCNLKEHISLQI